MIILAHDKILCVKHHITNIQKPSQFLRRFYLSGREDSNFRPLAPHASTLANCATPRIFFLKELFSNERIEIPILPTLCRDTLALPTGSYRVDTSFSICLANIQP